jgi:hypothetical protein
MLVFQHGVYPRITWHVEAVVDVAGTVAREINPRARAETLRFQTGKIIRRPDTARVSRYIGKTVARVAGAARADDRFQGGESLITSVMVSPLCPPIVSASYSTWEQNSLCPPWPSYRLLKFIIQVGVYVINLRPIRG